MKVVLAVVCAMLLAVALVQVSKDQASTGISVPQSDNAAADGYRGLDTFAGNFKLTASPCPTT
jgi:hypothetical protein